MGKKVFIGVGHGGSDSGAAANGWLEKELNLSIAMACHAELIRHGVYSLMSRLGDENDTLEEEIRECNYFAPDICIDIHNNAGGGDGAEAWYHYGGGVSKTLADNVLGEIVKIGQNSRGAKTRLWGNVDYYGFIRETKAPAIIVECAFVDNPKDMQIIDNIVKQKAMGVAIAKGILKTLGIKYVAAGDANNDGRVDLTDAARVMKYIAGWKVDLSTIGADTNGDGRVDLKDAAAIMKILAGWK